MDSVELTQLDLMEISTYMMTYVERFIIHNETITSFNLCKLFVKDGRLDYVIKRTQQRPEVRILCFTLGGVGSLMHSKCDKDRVYEELYVLLLGNHIFDPFNRMFGILIKPWVKSHEDLLFLEADYSDKVSTAIAKELVESYVAVSGRSLETLDNLADYGLKADIVNIPSNTYKLGDCAKEFFIHQLYDGRLMDKSAHLRSFINNTGR